EGACLPEELAGNPRVRALGLSLCRGLYLDERTGRRKGSAQGVVRVLRTFLGLLDQEMDRVARLRLDRSLAPKFKKSAPIPSPVIKAARLKGRTE
ncbi:MAG: hypothetical protein LBC90_02285, partial [Candidatus Adiutrix sp.]|nr:hypothetical protein [Candidatus Adiutrix sp.]